MSRPDLSDPQARESFAQEVLAAANRAVRRALLRSKKLGHRIVDWRAGKAVWVEASEIVVPEEQDPHDRAE